MVRGYTRETDKVNPSQVIDTSCGETQLFPDEVNINFSSIAQGQNELILTAQDLNLRIQ